MDHSPAKQLQLQDRQLEEAVQIPTVQLQQVQQNMDGAAQQPVVHVQRKMEITPENTTLIGDYTSVVFDEFDTKWLVQAQGNATFGSTLALVRDGMINIEKRYIFLQLGGNQVRSLQQDKLYSYMLDLVVAIREKSPESHIFVIGVLPKIVDNQEIKPFIMKFNRYLAATTENVNSVFERIRFLPVHLHFLDGTTPTPQLFDDTNPLLLSKTGAIYFKQIVFKLAGFIKNV